MVPRDLIETLTRFGQSHLLDVPERDLRSIDVALVRELFEKRDQPLAALPARDRIAPLPAEPWEAIPESAKRLGERAIANGELAVLLVAGGQGSRLGFDHPKGMFPIGPSSGASLFEIHAAKVWKLRQKFGGRVPLLVMTSPATHDETVAFFRANRSFDLPEADVHFFQQGMMPAVDRETGQLLLEAPGRLFLSPNGHGGTLTALADSGLLARLKADGTRHIFYFQVDNPLVRVGDPAFLGRHIETASDASSKVVFKTQPGERVGVLALVDGRCAIVEYSDLPPAMAEERDAAGDLLFRAGSPAIHLFRLDFLERCTTGATRLPYHIAKKKVPYYDPTSKQTVTPTVENALKFELFVFDALPLAERWLAVEVKRHDEFAPLKNATGPDSADDVQRAILAQGERWLRAAGHPNPVPTEISPRVALGPDDLPATMTA
jgi:UDP-N-acetylglucosamine/UDP-N-acetylgalactosamine diphosphorylase